MLCASSLFANTVKQNILKQIYDKMMLEHVEVIKLNRPLLPFNHLRLMILIFLLPITFEVFLISFLFYFILFDFTGISLAHIDAPSC